MFHLGQIDPVRPPKPSKLGRAGVSCSAICNLGKANGQLTQPTGITGAAFSCEPIGCGTGLGGNTGRAIPPDTAQSAGGVLTRHRHAFQSGGGVPGARYGQPSAGRACGAVARRAATRARVPR